MSLYKEVGRPTCDSIKREQALPKVTNAFIHRDGEGEKWKGREGRERGGEGAGGGGVDRRAGGVGVGGVDRGGRGRLTLARSRDRTRAVVKW
jgi:hypothetical protein